MQGPELEATLLRLRRIEGQVRGLQRMLSQGDECNDVLTQMMAVRAGLEQVSLVLFDYHVRTCLLGESDVLPERLDELSQTVRLWMRFGAPAAQVPD
jgi:CsoR family transcriptional regulator, copper-sensing transcriptional repressor